MNDEPLRRRRQRRLLESERALWVEVTRDVALLRPARIAEPDAKPEAKPDVEAPPQSAPKATPRSESPQSPPGRAQTQPPPLAPLGRRMRQRIARGGHAIGGRLDLHGLTQREAHGALLGFLHTAQGRGATVVLIITGKGAPGAEGGRGVLKRQVPLWLRLPEYRDLVVGFEPAHVTHGGEGALYVRLRRQREPV